MPDTEEASPNEEEGVRRTSPERNMNNTLLDAEGEADDNKTTSPSTIMFFNISRRKAAQVTTTALIALWFGSFPSLNSLLKQV